MRTHMTNRRNFYRLLQVQPEAPLEVIRSSFRALMRECKFHPDLGGAHAEAALMIEAYETLSDPQRRAEYDRTFRPKSLSVASYATTTTHSAAGAALPENRRRSFRRMDKSGAITWCIDGKVGQGEMIDLSPAGMLFLCGETLSSGSVIRITNSLLDATASVSQCRKTAGARTWAVGVKFISVNFEKA